MAPLVEQLLGRRIVFKSKSLKLFLRFFIPVTIWFHFGFT